MHLDLNDPIFGQPQAVKCTSADTRTFDNYVHWGHAEPLMINGRRMYSALQLIGIDFTVRLADIFKIPPSIGTGLARELIHEALPVIEDDAANIGEDAAWVGSALYRGSVVRQSEELEFDADGVHVVFPVQLFARMVLQNAAMLLREERV